MLLREFYRIIGNNNVIVKVGDVVLVYDEGLWINWKFVVVEELLFGRDSYVCVVNIWI